MEYYEFECGCKVEILNNEIKEFDNLPSLYIDYENINLDCPKTWALLSSGKTRGVFQLETPLGMNWAKKAEPSNIEEMSALISILRPSCLKGKVDGKSIAQHYVDRKSGQDEVKDIDFNVSDLLYETKGLILYQENSLQIAQRLAGFDLKDADTLRRATSKKLASLMAKVRVEFIEGCKKTGLVNDEKANEIFDIIEKSNRYSFNKSLSPNTLCQLLSGELKEIKELDIGDWIKTPQGYSEVKNKFDHGELETFAIKLENEKQIECSINHKFLCEDGVFPLYEIMQCGKKIRTDNSTSCFKIISFIHVGKKRLVDIEINTNEHIFYGNGIATSNSHAVSYGVTSYWTAWVKQHFPLSFFSAWLSFSDKDDVGDFINDSKDFNVDIKNPSILLENENFKIVDGKIYCGIGNIKGVGETTAIKTLQMIKEIQTEVGKEIKDFSWKEVLILLAPKLTKTTFINLVAAGAFSHLNLYRKRMMFEYNQMSSLTGKPELPWLIQNINSYETLAQGVEGLIKAEVASKSRIPKIDSCLKVLTDKSFTTVDDEVWVSAIEEELIGGSLSCSKLDVCDTTCGDTTCSEFESRDTEKKMSIACQVNRISLYTPKNGKKMLYVTLKDSTGSLEAVVFSDNLEKVESVLYKGNTVCVTGKKTAKGSLSVYDATQI